MNLTTVPNAERLHIALFGRRNAGKSSFINALTGQSLAIVSEQKGTTTDPVYKAMELLPLGPVILIDTPGLDDSGSLGALRVQKALAVLNKTDIALIVCDICDAFSVFEQDLLKTMREKKIPHLIVLNKADLYPGDYSQLAHTLSVQVDTTVIAASAERDIHITEVKASIAELIPQKQTKKILDGILQADDIIVLVIPIDSAAPKGRLILPQQQVLREILDSHATAIVVQPEQLTQTLDSLSRSPDIVITDSQAFGTVAQHTPADIPLTSFSILFARYKGELAQLVHGVSTLSTLCDQDRVLIAEGCTHHRQCDDIGTVKIPRWLKQYTQKELQLETVSGTEFPPDLSGYKLVIHCGGCMLNEAEMKHRISTAKKQQIPMINYGVLIACVNGILNRALKPFAHELSNMNGMIQKFIKL